MMPKKTACICIKSDTPPVEGMTGAVSSGPYTGSPASDAFALGQLSGIGSAMPMMVSSGMGGMPMGGGMGMMGRSPSPQQMIQQGMMPMNQSQRVLMPLPETHSAPMMHMQHGMSMHSGVMAMHPATHPGSVLSDPLPPQPHPHPPAALNLMPSSQAMPSPADIGTGSPMKAAAAGRAARCGQCRTCSNPRLKKACLTVRRQQKQNHSGNTSPSSSSTTGSNPANSCPVEGGSSPMHHNATSTMSGPSSQSHMMASQGGYHVHHSMGAPPPSHVPMHQTSMGPPPPAFGGSSMMKMGRSMSVPSLAQLEWMQHASHMAADRSYNANSPPSLLSEHSTDKKLASMPEESEGYWDESVNPFQTDMDNDGLTREDVATELPRNKSLGLLAFNSRGMSKAESMPNLSQYNTEDDFEDDVSFEYDDADDLVGHWSGELSLDRFGGGVSQTLGGDIMDLDRDDDGLQPLGDMSRYFNLNPTTSMDAPPSSSNANDLQKIHEPTSMYIQDPNIGNMFMNMSQQGISHHQPHFTGMPTGMDQTSSRQIPASGYGQSNPIAYRQADHLSAKRVSRIMANRLSAAKSRVKKLQHTAELEGRVKQLQNGIEDIRPKVHSLQKQHNSLQVENSGLKLRLTKLQERKNQQETSIAKLQEEIRQLSSVADFSGMLNQDSQQVGSVAGNTASNKSHMGSDNGCGVVQDKQCIQEGQLPISA